MIENFAYQRQQALLSSDLDLNILDTSIVYDKMPITQNMIVFIGEAPGATEVKEGIPFCGVAGKNLQKLVGLTGLKKQDYYLANSFAFRPLSKTNANRAPNKKELEFGAYWLLRELDIIKPAAIVALGDKAINALFLLNNHLSVAFKNLARHEISYSNNILIGRVFHPSPLVYNMPHKRCEMEKFFIELGNKLGTKK